MKTIDLSRAVLVPKETKLEWDMRRLGWTRETDPVKVERDLMACVPRKDWIYFGHALIWHGRRVCFAASPNCPGCLLNKVCPKRGV